MFSGAFGYFWVFLGIFGYFWVFLGNFGQFWVLLGILGILGILSTFYWTVVIGSECNFFVTDVMWYEVLSYAVVELCVT